MENTAENYKEEEVNYYNRKAEAMLESDGAGDFEGFNPLALKSFRFFYQKIKENCQDKLVLDYGCGNGIHSFFPIENKAKMVIGVDLSEKSLILAKKKALENGFSQLVDFRVMDCEKMTFPDNFFDLVIDGGVFSSLDLDKALPEIARVLKPKGMVVGVETLGHNPLTNLKRELSNKRTKWAKKHIFKVSGLEKAGIYFKGIKADYFHLFSWPAFPLMKLPVGSLFLKLLELIETPLLKISSLKKYGFKIVFILSEPKKNA